MDTESMLREAAAYFQALAEQEKEREKQTASEKLEAE
jgi:hypothetical protein